MGTLRASVLGVGISTIDLPRALETIDEWVAEEESHYVTVTPGHAVMDAYADPELRRIFNASGMTTPDGMSIVWFLKLRGFRHVARVYGPDLMLAVCAAGIPKGYRHFFYGGGSGTADTLRERLSARFPGLVVCGTHCPPFGDLSKLDDDSVVEMVNSARPDIVWVGLSSPKQERWMAEHVGRLHAPVLVGVGAAFDFLSGRKRQAPNWMQSTGFEWLFRLMSEPRRLGPRYAKYPRFIWLLACQLLGLRHYPLD